MNCTVQIFCKWTCTSVYAGAGTVAKKLFAYQIDFLGKAQLIKFVLFCSSIHTPG